MESAVFGPKNMPKTTKLSALLEKVVAEVERMVEVSLGPAEVEERGYQALLVFVHELLHGALNQALPELSDPTDPQKDLAQEICVRILEDHVCEKLGLPHHTPQEHVDELFKLFPNHSIAPKDYEGGCKKLAASPGSCASCKPRSSFCEKP